MKLVRQLMTADVRTCAPTDSLATAARLMDEGRCGTLVVVDAGKLSGILTDRDVCLALGRRDAAPGTVRVEEAMTRTLHTVRDDAPAEEALEALADHKVHRLPVTDARGSLVGILSLHDVAREAADELRLIARGEKRTREVRAEDVGEALGRLSQDWPT